MGLDRIKSKEWIQIQNLFVFAIKLVEAKIEPGSGQCRVDSIPILLLLLLFVLVQAWHALIKGGSRISLMIKSGHK